LKLWYSNSLKFYKPTFYKSISYWLELHVLVIFRFKVLVFFNSAVKNPSLMEEGTLKTGYGENTEQPLRVGGSDPPRVRPCLRVCVKCIPMCGYVGCIDFCAFVHFVYWSSPWNISTSTSKETHTECMCVGAGVPVWG